MNHLQQYLVDEFVEDYQEGHLTRREAFQRLLGIVGTSAAAQLLAACGQPGQTGQATVAPQAATSVPEASPAAATSTPEASPTAATPTAAPTSAASGSARVAPDDPDIVIQRVRFPSGDATISAYMASPVRNSLTPIVLVCHENRGLTAHIEDVTRRVAKAGYIGLAVDLLSREGGTASIADQASIPGLLSAAPPERHVQDFKAGLDYVKQQPYAKADSAGMLGICFGGGVTWLVAAGVPELRAAVPFYGPPVPTEQLVNINAAVLAIYAGNDQRINASIETVEQAMQQYGKTYQKIVYPGVDHAFHNDTGQRYNAEAAQAAWKETLAWFGQYL